MKGLLNGYLIDPVEQEVTWRSFSESKMRNVIGCDKLELVYLHDENRVLVLDEDGLLKNNQRYWKYGDMNNVLNNAFAGKGIILGFDFDKGEFLDICPDFPDKQTDSNIILECIENTFVEIYNKVSFVEDEDYVEEPFFQFVPMENL
jgi:hypothetical protein